MTSLGVVLDEIWEDFSYFMDWVWGGNKIFAIIVSALLLAVLMFVGNIFILLIEMLFVFPHA